MADFGDPIRVIEVQPVTTPVPAPDELPAWEIEPVEQPDEVPA